MQGVTHRLRPFVLGGLLLAIPLTAVQAKNVKPDPNGLAPHQVQDLAYGDVLFYFFQDDYFDSITRLLAARQLGRVPHTQEEAELLLAAGRLQIRPELINAGGLLSGVATYALVDYCMGSTLWVETTREESIATINIEDQFETDMDAMMDGEEKRRAQAYLKGGFGGLVGFEIKGGAEAGRRFIAALELFYHVANIGDARSLAIHPASTTHSQLELSEQLTTGVTPGLVRLSIGIETLDDILADLDAGLRAAKSS